MKKNLIKTLLLLFIISSIANLRAQVSLEHVLIEKRLKPVCTAYSYDSKFLAAGCTNNIILIWSVTEKKVIKQLTGLSYLPISLAFSRDNKLLISGGKDRLVTIWNVTTGQKLKALKGHRENILSVDISPDNQSIVSAGIDKSIKIWNINSGQLLYTLTGHKHQVNSAIFNSDGTKLLSASADRTIIEWDAKTGKPIRTLSNEHTDWIRKALYSSNGKYIVSCGDDNYIKIWNNHTGLVVNTIMAHKDNVYTFSFSPDGEYIVSGGHDKRLVLIEVETGKIEFQSDIEENYIVSVSFAPNGKSFASAVLYSDKLKIWNASKLGITPADVKILPERAITEVKIEPPKKTPPKILCVIPVDSINRTKKSVFPIHLQFESESTISKVDLFVNGKLFSTYISEDLRKDTQGKAHLERNLFLSQGTNKILAIAETEDGLSARKQRVVIYALPKRAELDWNAGLSDQMETNSQIITLENYIHSQSNLATISLYNNQKLIYTEKDIEVPPDSNLVHFSRSIALFEGSNRLKLEVINEGGTAESDILTIKYLPKKTKIEVIIPPAKPNPYRFALIIGNEDYSSYQVGLESESNVEFAKNDAVEFRKYAIKYLGVPEDQAILKINSRYIEMKREIKKTQGIIELTNGKAEFFFYYAGHGYPHEKTKEPYIIPVDGNGTDLEFSAIKLKDIYSDFTKYPSARVTVFLDACFSGGGRNQGIMAARGVKIKPKEEAVKNKMVVFSAASENQTSLPYMEKEHGIFTYFLLQKIEESGGIITYKELSDYIIEQVGIKSYLINSKKQVPEINVSPEVYDVWEKWRLR